MGKQRPAPHGAPTGVQLSVSELPVGPGQGCSAGATAVLGFLFCVFLFPLLPVSPQRFLNKSLSQESLSRALFLENQPRIILIYYYYSIHVISSWLLDIPNNAMFNGHTMPYYTNVVYLTTLPFLDIQIVAEFSLICIMLRRTLLLNLYKHS